MWKTAPTARVEDLDAVQEEPERLLTPVALRYEDAAQYQVSLKAFSHAWHRTQECCQYGKVTDLVFHRLSHQYAACGMALCMTAECVQAIGQAGS